MGGAVQRLKREPFLSSRKLEFCGPRELVAQTGHQVERWPLVIAKELIDNAIDGAEETDAALEVEIRVSIVSGEIQITDNGPGIPAATIDGIIDYATKVSSREAYVSPTRGAQGNALKTIIAMPFAPSGERGESVIEAHGIMHRIVFAVDHVRQEPRVTIEASSSSVKNGTRITLPWPHSASWILAHSKERFLQVVDGFSWFNPHLKLRVWWNGQQLLDAAASNPSWHKWVPSDPTSAHWYDLARFERYIAAHVSRGRETGRDFTVREFIAEFRGLAGTGKQKLVLQETGTSRTSLSALFTPEGQIRHDETGRLLAGLRRHSRPVKPRDLGIIGREHLFRCLAKNGGREETFRYRSVLGHTEGLPWVVEAAFGWCPDAMQRRCTVIGINWSVALGNPFRSLGRGPSLDSVLTRQRADEDEPVVVAVHLACPHIDYTDRGKTAAVIR